jgi:hypothetical protein
MKTINKKTTIMTSITIATLLLAGSSFMGMQEAFAVPVTVGDPSFELGPNPALGDGGYTTGGPNTYWTFTASNSGYFNPNAGYADESGIDGDNVAWVRTDATVCQTLTGETITEGINYRLSVLVGDRLDQVSPGYDIQLLDDSDTVLASIDETDFPINPDGWIDTSLDYLVLPLDPSIDADLKICLSTPASGSQQTLFDNVRLRALEPYQVCNEDTDIEESICKTVIIDDESGNEIIAIGEKVTYNFVVDVVNNDDETWFDTVLTDSFPGNLAVGDVGADLTDWEHAQLDNVDFEDNFTCTFEQTGKKTFVEHITCLESGDGNLDQGEDASFGVTAETDYNHGQSKKYMRTSGDQGVREYTSCGYHETNPGATLSYFLATQDPLVDDPYIITTGPTTLVPVYQSNNLAESDCDGDEIYDDVDKCPFIAEDVDGVLDEDGCPDTEVTFQYGWDYCFDNNCNFGNFDESLDLANSYVSYSKVGTNDLDVTFHFEGADANRDYQVGIHNYPSDCDFGHAFFGVGIPQLACLEPLTRQLVIQDAAEPFEFGTITTNGSGVGDASFWLTDIDPDTYDLQFHVREDVGCNTVPNTCAVIFQAPGPFGTTHQITIP